LREGPGVYLALADMPTNWRPRAAGNGARDAPVSQVLIRHVRWGRVCQTTELRAITAVKGPFVNRLWDGVG